MLRDKNQIPDLKVAILELKKEIATLKETNQTLKVKNRKQQNEITKKDKQIEALLDPRKSNLMKKVLSEKGASLVLNLQEKNKKLEKTLMEKDSVVNRLRNDLQTIKLYGARATSRKKTIGSKLGVETKLDVSTSFSGPCLEFDEANTNRSAKSQNTNQFKLSSLENSKETTTYDTPHSVELSPVPSITSTDATEINLHMEPKNEDLTKVTEFFEDFSRQELISIISDLRNKQIDEVHQNKKTEDLKPKSSSTDLERNELYSETPHKEIQQLQDYFLDMLTEVDLLKTTISELKLEQINTAIILKQKENYLTCSSSVGQLAEEIKNLKKTQSAYKTSARTKRKIRSASSKLVTSQINVYDYSKNDKKIINEQSKKSDKLQKIIKILPMSANDGLLSAQEDEMRRNTYNNLMEQMLQSTIRLKQLTHGDN